MPDLRKTPLYPLHMGYKARMVAFAGYSLPIQYESGILSEHLHTRNHAGLFDVSHMGQIKIDGPSYSQIALGLERLIPVDVLGLAQGRQRYGFFTNDMGGITDDLMLVNRGDHVLMVVNAACKVADVVALRVALEPELVVTPLPDRALIALQGPLAEAALSRLNANVSDMSFLEMRSLLLRGVECWVSRSGYTGEDGFEISVPGAAALPLAKALLAQPGVAAIGLGARDSLRLEAGLCLFGHDITPETTPVEAGLSWAIQRVRRPGGERAGGFPGADRIFAQMADGADRQRVGLIPSGRAPMREGVLLFSSPDAKDPIGAITSGGFGASIEGPIAMGYVDRTNSKPGGIIFGELRGKRLPLKVTSLPFLPNRFKR